MGALLKIDGKPVGTKAFIVLTFLVLFPFLAMFIWLGITMNYIHGELNLFTTNIEDYLFYGGLLLIVVTMECVVLTYWVVGRIKKQ